MKYYAVRRGHKTGIFTSWDITKKYVLNFSKAEYKSFNTQIEAQNYINNKPKLEIIYLTEDAIYTDGGQNSQTGNEAWGCVVDKKGRDLICHYKHLTNDLTLKEENLPVGVRNVIVSKFNGVKQQNNGAELLALVLGLRIALENKKIKTIYCDSDLLVKYWSKKLGSDKREEMTIVDRRKVEYIDELIKLRLDFEKMGGSIVKIDGAKNLADLGYH